MPSSKTWETTVPKLPQHILFICLSIACFYFLSYIPAERNVLAQNEPSAHELIHSLKDTDKDVRISAAGALGELATTLRDAKATDMIPQLNAALEAL
jgi:hypothetical protein